MNTRLFILPGSSGQKLISQTIKVPNYTKLRVNSSFSSQVGLIPRLRQLLPGLKVKMGLMRRQVKQSDENFGLISMAKTNLTRFIKYKEKRPIVARANKV